MVNDQLGKRMKSYESVTKTKLTPRTPAIIRIDGKAFHTFTKGFQKPFDNILIKSMQYTMKYLCENIQGCVLGYTQSDEITLILVDYQNLETSAWFGGQVQKICSVAASMATMFFNRVFNEYVNTAFYNYADNLNPLRLDLKKEQYTAQLRRAARNGAMFDARVFNIPKEEVTNLLYWRQLDAIRNSIQMVGQANFSHRKLQNKSCNTIKQMLLETNIDWDALDTVYQRGSCCIKKSYQSPNVDPKDGVCERQHWIIDTNIPIFKDNRDYIDKLIYIGGDHE